jgi:thiol-disulfide isomerase/thioredoxin
MNMQIKFLLSVTVAIFTLSSSMAAEIGNKVPACALTQINDNQPFNLQQFQGKVVYVDFWASWCGPCAKSFPFLNEMYTKLKDQGLQIVGINLDENPDDAKGFLAKYPASFTVTTDTQEQCAKSFDVKAMPSSYIIDKKGIIRKVHLGFRAGEAEELRLLVEQLLTENQTGN